MKKHIYVILMIVLFISGDLSVNASSGQLKKSSIKTCNGITYGQHSSDNHWHVAKEKNGRYYATGSSIYSDPCNSSSSNNNSDYNSKKENTNDHFTNDQVNSLEQLEIKSSDNTLTAIIIDGKIFDTTKEISYSTANEDVSIQAITNNEKATYKVKGYSDLSIGNNRVIIEVTAEDGTIKDYDININREIVLSTDTGIKVFVNQEKVNFNELKATVYVSSSTKDISIDYTLSDEKSKVEINEIDELKTGDNDLEIKVTAEDGSNQIYKIKIHKYSKIEEIISTILAFSIVGGMSYGIYFIIKKILKLCKIIMLG